MANDYSKKKNAELEELLKSRSLPHTGKKAELIARLHESDLKLSSLTSATSAPTKHSAPSSIPNEPIAKKSTLSSTKAPEFKPPSTVAEDEIDWEEDDSSIIPPLITTTAAPNPPPTPPPASTSTPSSATIADSNPPKTSSTSATNASATAPSAPPASSSASLTASAPTTLPISKRNAAIDPSKTHDLTVRYPEPKPVNTAPKKSTEAASTTAPKTTTTKSAPAPTATVNVKALAAETPPASDASQSKPAPKLGDDVARLAKRMNRFGDGSGAYAIKRAAELAAGKTEEEIAQSVEGNEGNTTDKAETKADLEARKLRERAKKFGTLPAPVKGLDEALPEHGAKRRRNNFDDGGRGGKRFRGNDGGPRRGNVFRRGGGGNGRPAGNRNGNNNNRDNRIGRSGFSEKDRLAAEARKAKFAAPPPA